MPTVLFKSGFRFFFYSNENDEPAHIHVRKGQGEGKVWLLPKLEIAWTKHFTLKEEKIIWEIILENELLFKIKWDEYFSK
jgi:hypothetical protein